MLVRFLRLEGLTTVEAEEGRRALELALTTQFAVILLDVALPSLDGLMVCEAIRRSSMNRSTPVVLYASNAAEADKVAGLNAGADDYVSKPFQIPELMARVRALTRRRR